MKRERGFTLIEVVVAFAILCLLIGVLYQAFAQTITGADRAQKRQAALQLAQSVLASWGKENEAAAGVTEGSDGAGMHWTVEATSYSEPGREAPWPVPAFDVHVSVSWGSAPAERVELRSLVLGRAP